MATALVIAKTLFKYDSDLEATVNSMEARAEIELIRLIGKESYNRYKNGLALSDAGFAITAFKLSDVSTDMNPKTTVTATMEYLRDVDNIVIAGTTNYNGYYTVSRVNREDGTFDIDKKFVATETGTYSIQEFELMKEAHAWLILYMITYAFQEYLGNKVLITSEDFGDGQMRAYSQAEIRALRLELKNKARSYVGGSVVIC